MRLHRAAWVLPISAPPIPDGAVAVEGGRIVGVGPFSELRRRCPGDVTDCGDALLLPGLVNAHTHLEWSFLRGAIGPRRDFVGWVREITERRLATPLREVSAAVGEAVSEVVATGTVAVGEVLNNVNFSTATSVEYLAAGGLQGVGFVELLGFQGERAAEILQAGQEALEMLRAHGSSLLFHLSPHAPYSVSPALFRLIRAQTERRTVHLAENDAEVRLLASGDGPWSDLLRERGRWDPSWSPPGVSPVRYLDGLGFLDDRTLCVHVVHVDAEDIAVLRKRETPVCLCPRSNARLSVGRAPARRLFDAGLTVALGTDSLASSEDLDMFAEMRALRDQNPGLSQEEIVRAATLNGAIALGLERDLGSLAPGKSARFIGVKVKEIDDPYEGLLSENLKVFYPYENR
ncbi:amidohydrolase family protein [bacterium]|nr:amidohydrolase family protein [bacterium]